MLWVLILHIIGFLVWMGSVLYVPIVICAQARYPKNFSKLPNGIDSVARLVFSYIASPAAIIAIIAGTAVFVIADIVTFWLLVKLTLVSFMICLHACLGLLITRLERGQTVYLKRLSIGLLAALLTCAVCTFYIVLSKPNVPGVIPWAF